MHPQLPLSFGLKDSATFATFVSGPNAEALASLTRLTGSAWEPHVYLWGTSGTGKSHLLQAICHAAGERDTTSVYLPLASLEQFPCTVLDGLENLAIVCIDDVECIAQREDWELALRNLFERIQETRSSLIIAGNAPSSELGLALPQLESRLAGCLLLSLKPLPETERTQALRLRATHRGLNLSGDVERYLLRHFGEPLGNLFEALDILDTASLAAQRKLTVPFVRDTLKAAGFGESG
ncbi:MAG: DnaA regulatory inactivator Hda [Gammaproteobacteria bacterium]|nr:DnaA regulatory inactivator Hda [Gammaproteobacteria bacterium]MCP5424670.1 DnaA regulatory inactivator Hda [Gammaproteobacteria bacterium]